MAQNITKQVEEIENLTFRLEEVENEKQSQLDVNEKLSSAVVKAESNLTLAETEIGELKSELSTNAASAEQNLALQKQLEEVEDQADVSLKQVDSLTAKIRQFEHRLGIKTEELEAATISQTERDDQLAELNAQIKLLQQRTNETELQLAEKSESLATQQAVYAELEGFARQENDDLTLQVTKNSELEASVKSLESQILQTQQELAKTVNLLEREKLTREEIEATVARQAEKLSVLSAGKSNIEAELKPLQMRAQEAERKLEEAVKLLDQERALNAGVAKTADEADAELDTQQSKILDLEASVESLESQIQEISGKLEQTTSELETTRSMQVELEATTQQQEAELSQKDAQYTELEAKLRETVEANSNELTSESEKLRRQGVMLEELRVALQNEKFQRSENFEELQASQIRLAELEQQSEIFSVEELKHDELESDNDELVERVAKYKAAYRKNLAVMNGLAERKTKMRKLATEYLTVARILRRKLDVQLEITADLEQRLDGVSFDEANSSDLSLLVEERARADVLALKAEFEQRLARKNKKIQKLQNQNPSSLELGIRRLKLQEHEAQ